MHDPRREHDRYAFSGLQCEMGHVLNLSGGGMCVVSKWRPPVALGETYITTLSLAGESHQITGEAVWCRRSGLMHYQSGFRFVDLTGVKLQQLLRNIDQLLTSQQAAEHPDQIRAAFCLPNYFDILGLPLDASEGDIVAAYAAQHADAQTMPELTNKQKTLKQERLKRLRQAHNVLTNPQQRLAIQQAFHEAPDPLPQAG